MHSLQVLPLLGFWLHRCGQGPGLVRAAAAVYFLAFAALLAGALAGRPLLASLR